MDKKGIPVFLLSIVCGFVGAALFNGDTEAIGQCAAPFAAIAIIIGLFIGTGLLLDPKGMISFLSSIKSDWEDILDDKE